MAAADSPQATTILQGAAAGRCLAAGVRRGARAIAASLGRGGRAVLMHRPPASPKLLMDGYAIAREVAEEAGPGSLGMRLLKEALFDADRHLGDGTATLALLVDGLYADGGKLVRAGYAAGE